MTVAWFSFFPIEWLPGIGEPWRSLPRQHPATWQRVLLAELEKIPSLRLHIIVLRKEFERDATFERNGVVFHLIKTRGGLRAPSLFWHDTLLIKPVLKRIQPDVVHAWGTEKGAALVAARLGYPAVVTVQGLMTWMAELFPLTLGERVTAVLERLSLGRARVTTGESTFSSGYVRRRYPGADVRHIDMAPDPLFAQVIRQPQTSPVRLLFIGGLGPRKGGDTLLLALEQLRREISFELVVIGEGEAGFLERMKAATSAELWSRLRFKNHLTSEQVAQELAVATLMVCPTRADTGPLAVKEAVMAGVPVVASAIGGVPDYVEPGENGLLFAPGDVPQCAEALRAACRHPLFGRGLVEPSVLAQKRAALSAARMGRSFFEAYQDVCGQREQAGTTK